MVGYLMMYILLFHLNPVVFTSDGTFMIKLEVKSKDEFNYSMDIAVDSDGNVFAADI
jgi:hypothetical protein